MRSQTRSAFSLAVCSALFILIGWLIPFWFGRWYPDTKSKRQWGLFYMYDCRPGRCITTGEIINKSNVDFAGADAPLELEAIAVIATLGLALVLLGHVAVIIFHFSICGRRASYHGYVIAAVIIFLFAAFFIFLTIIMASVASGVFFSKRKMESVIEFPWSILCYCIGEITLITSAVLYLTVTCQWKRFRHIYASKRYYFPQEYQWREFSTYEPQPDYLHHHSRRYRQKPYQRKSFFDCFTIDRNKRVERPAKTYDNGAYVLPDNDFYYIQPRRRYIKNRAATLGIHHHHYSQHYRRPWHTTGRYDDVTQVGTPWYELYTLRDKYT